MKRHAIAILAFLCAGTSVAQSSADVNAGIQYNFSSPGARSLAQGGAFIADANDATAAYANPAGLVHVPRPEMSIETRGSRFVNSFNDRGHAFGSPTGKGNDTVSGIQTGRSSDDARNLAFSSVVVPTVRVTFAAYTHELANFAASASTNGVFLNIKNPQPGVSPAQPTILLRQDPAVSALRVKIAGVGAAAGFHLTDRLSAGLGVVSYRSSINSVTRRYEPTLFFGDPDTTRLKNFQTQQGRSRKWTVNGGLLAEVTPKFSAGASIRRGFSFPVEVQYYDRDVPRPARTASFNVPSFYGLGVSIRPTDNWSMVIDVNRITYADTTRNFSLLLPQEPRLFVPNGTEVRAGTEITLTRDRFRRLPFPISLAIGGWRDPDHSIRISNPTEFESVLFRPPSTDYHVTGGIGVLIRDVAQFHAAFNRSSRQKVVSMSAMARF
jgi:long-chain fatty acid transport protein